MAQIMQDKYVLAQSPSQTITTIGQELRVDLQLVTTTNSANAGKVTGIVSDVNAKPIVGALVKLMDTNYKPISHAITDSSGSYTLNNIAPGSYCVFAIAQGMALQQSPQFSVVQLQTSTQNLTLQSDPAMSLAIIPGIVLDAATNSPVSGAVVSLYSVASGGAQTLQAILYTNSYGQFVFRQIPIGNYSVSITALGYTATTATAAVTTAGQIVPLKVAATPDASAGTGTISGIITDSTSTAISGADVILYKVNTDNSLTPIAFTRTNTNGIYLFGNVAPGSYKVKSNQTQLVTVDVSTQYSPDFDYFGLTNYSSLSVNAVAGTLAGGALLQSNNQVVGYIGGPTSGSVTISVTAPSAGNYIMGVQYINGDAAARTLLVDVNGTNTGTTYSCPQGGWNLYNMKIVNIPVTLAQGANTIKLYNTTAYGPSLRMIYFAPVISQDPTTGVYANGAATSAGYAGFIGGTTGGTVTMTVTAAIAGNYSISLPCRQGNTRGLTISVNGASAYTADTVGLATLVTNLPLNQGSNKIVFSSPSTAYATDIGPYTLTPAFAVQYFDATTATLAGSATVTNGFVTGIQSGNGSITLNPTVVGAGQYNFEIFYVAPDATKQCNIAVNGASTNQIYTFLKTTDLTAANELISTNQLTLTAGANTVKIFNQ